MRLHPTRPYSPVVPWDEYPHRQRADRAVRNVGFRTRHSIVTIPGPFGGRARGEGSQGMGLACLRISGTKERYVPVPDGEWTPLAFDFHIEDELADIELICEFQSQSGTASFDETSLRLVRE